MSTFEYVIDNNPSASDDKIIRDGIVNFNSRTINEKATHFSIFAKDGSQIIGGALIWEHSDALYIDVLWCDEHYRKKGVGTKIISMIDDVAINKGLHKIFVDTYAFQAQAFYQKHGFYCIGTIPEYLLGHDRMFMRKDVP
ncbi:TPA: GNAT family N-acetyltransferase [Legionella pneumophila]|nr:GNAT family N-acetyltransferase [Legionella pneumophila]HCJ1112898.1 GNAT family N-acetyltransferase [Legionella pneumophila]